MNVRVVAVMWPNTATPHPPRKVCLRDPDPEHGTPVQKGSPLTQSRSETLGGSVRSLKDLLIAEAACPSVEQRFHFLLASSRFGGP